MVNFAIKTRKFSVKSLTIKADEFRERRSNVADLLRKNGSLSFLAFIPSSTQVYMAKGIFRAFLVPQIRLVVVFNNIHCHSDVPYLFRQNSNFR